MPFDISSLIQQRSGENLRLHAAYINPQFAKVLKTIGFDKIFTSAEGPYLYDQEGNDYLDFLSGYGVFSIGRNHPVIKKTLKDFVDLDTASLIQMEAPLLSGLLAEKLVKRVGIEGMDKVFFTNSGTEANECAIKYARAATGRPRILFLEHAFHGLSTGSLSLNGNAEFRDGFGELLPGCHSVKLNDLQELEAQLKKKDVAAFFFEPIQGKGVYVPHDDYLPQAQELCRKEGTLFVADEIQTGLGRTGKWFGYEHWNLKPDIITLAKALSGGFVPVGATLCQRWIYEKVFSRMDRCVVHSSTFGQNNLAMVMGLATLAIIEEENLVEKAGKLGEELISGLRKLMSSHEWIKEVRGKGLMIGIEFGKPQSFMDKMKWNLIHKMDKGLFGELIVMPLMSQHRLITQVSGHHQDVVKLLPPFVIDQTHTAKFISALDAVLQECGQISGPLWKMGINLAKASRDDKKQAVGQ